MGWKDAQLVEETPAPKAAGKGMVEEYLTALQDLGLTAAKGFLTAGPMGAVLAPGHRAVEKVGELVSETGYRAGGAVTDIATKAGAPAELAAAAGYGTNVGMQAIPVVAGSIGRQAAPLLKRGGEWFMQSAIKPGPTMRRSGQSKEAIQTMLQKGISPTSSGLEAAKGAVDDLEVAIQTTLENSPALVHKAKVGEHIKVAFDAVKHNLNRRILIVH